ncbi:MAG: hypothetical protein Q9214_002222, partial [Letrouitia sp. 1 TL-2023]
MSLRNLLPTRQGSFSPAPSRYPLALILLTIAGVVFRSEIALLIGAHTLWNLLFRRRFALSTVIFSGAVGLIIGLSLTVPTDSFFWQQSPLWPELSAFQYNILQSR